MEDKELVTSSKITQLLIGYWLVWGVVLGGLYTIIFHLITSKMESMVLIAMIAIILQGIMAFIVWKLSSSSSFKKQTISYTEVPIVMKNLLTFTIVICLFNGIYNLSSVNSSIEKTLQSDFTLKYTESMMSYLYDDAQMQKYQAQKEKSIKEAKSKLYTYLVIVEIGLTVIYLAVLPLEKKEILKYVRY